MLAAQIAIKYSDLTFDHELNTFLENLQTLREKSVVCRG